MWSRVTDGTPRVREAESGEGSAHYTSVSVLQHPRLGHQLVPALPQQRLRSKHQRMGCWRYAMRLLCVALRTHSPRVHCVPFLTLYTFVPRVQALALISCIVFVWMLRLLCGSLFAGAIARFVAIVHYVAIARYYVCYSALCSYSAM